MDEYIKRKEAVAVACKGCNKEFSNEPCEPSDCHIQQGLFNIPVADVVEVVRCKDCIYYHKEIGYGFGKCSKCTLMPYPDDFCSYGERKDNERKVNEFTV